MKYRSRPEEAENPFWITYSDLLSSMVLLLLILLVVFIKISEAQRQRLLDERQKLQTTVKKNQKLLAQAPKLQEKSASLVNLKKELRALQVYLAERKLKVQLQDNDLTLSVDQTLLFGNNSDELKPEGKVFLTKFIPILANRITKNDYKELITGIVFEGRADPSFVEADWNTAYLHNLGVTLNRSQSVVKFVFGPSFRVAYDSEKPLWVRESRERFRYLVLASGRSSVDKVKKDIPDPDNLKKDWKSKQLWKKKDPGSRQVVIRLELYNPLPDFDFEEGSTRQ